MKVSLPPFAAGTLFVSLGLASHAQISGTVEPNDIVDGSLSYTTGDGLLTLTPQLDGLSAPFGGGTSSGGCCFGVINDQLNDTDGNPLTTNDQEAVLIGLDSSVGLTSLSVIFTRATTEILDDVVVGPLEDGIRISGFLSDPGSVYFDGSGNPDLTPEATFNNLSEVENVSYDDGTGTLNIDHAWRGGAITTFQFQNVDASLGQTLTVTVADQDEVNPQLNFRQITYGDTALDLPVLSIIAGDYNGDGFVSQGDLDLVLLNWGDDVVPVGFDEGALDGGGPFDGLVSQNELDGVLLNWGNGAPPSALAVPEPASAAMLSLVALIACHRRKSCCS